MRRGGENFRFSRRIFRFVRLQIFLALRDQIRIDFSLTNFYFVLPSDDYCRDLTTMSDGRMRRTNRIRISISIVSFFQYSYPFLVTGKTFKSWLSARKKDRNDERIMKRVAKVSHTRFMFYVVPSFG